MQSGTSPSVVTTPGTQKSIFNRLGIRKPSILSLSSPQLPQGSTARTFSLDDLLRPLPRRKLEFFNRLEIFSLLILHITLFLSHSLVSLSLPFEHFAIHSLLSLSLSKRLVRQTSQDVSQRQRCDGEKDFVKYFPTTGKVFIAFYVKFCWRKNFHSLPPLLILKTQWNPLVAPSDYLPCFGNFCYLANTDIKHVLKYFLIHLNTLNSTVNQFIKTCKYLVKCYPLKLSFKTET